MVFERLKRSFSLIKESWAVLTKDKEMLLYPLLSGIISIVLLFAIFMPFVFAILAGQVGFGVFFFAFIIFYLVVAVVGTFFTASLIAAAHMRLHGKDPKFSDGLHIASKRMGSLIVWGLINGTVGLLLRSFSDRDNIIGTVVSTLLQMAWTLLTLFTIPVILFEKKGVIDSLKGSGKIFVKTWGESVVGQFSIGAIFGIGFLFGLLLLFAAFLSGSFVLFVIIFVIVVIFLIVLYLITSALNGIYITALYIYATSKKVPKGFSKEFIENAFQEKKKIPRGFVR